MIMKYSRDIEIKYETDVLIVGGGPSGVAAAVFCARNEGKVLLVEQSGTFGGSSALALVPEIVNLDDGENFLSEGIGREVHEALFGEPAKNRRGYNVNMANLKCLYDNMMLDSGSKFLFYTRIVDAVTENNKIKYVIASANEGVFAIKAKFFIDCSGNGSLCVMAGEDYDYGDENGVPMSATLCSMWGGVDFARKKTDSVYTEKAYEDGVLSQYDTILPGIKANYPEAGAGFGNVGHVFGLDDRKTEDMTDAMVFARKILSEYENYYRKYIDGCENSVLLNSANYMGIRSSRRIKCIYTFGRGDYFRGESFDDEIGRYSYPIDIHPVTADKSGMKDFEASIAECHSSGESYSIPYRCLYSKNIKNLMMAGRNISVSHIALGTTRVQATIASIGQVCGTAAAMCIKKNLTPRDLGKMYLEKLRQQLLKDDQYIPGLQNTDRADLARKAKITASSISREELYVQEIGVRDGWLPLDCIRGSFLPRRERTQIQDLYLMLKNDSEHAIDVRISVREQTAQDVSYASNESATGVQSVPAGYQGWVQFHVPMALNGNGIWVVMEPIKGISWRVLKMAPIDCTRSVWNEEWGRFPTVRDESHMVAFEKPVEEIANCAGENVINGYSRAVSSKDYCWVSDPKQKLPQWIQLEFEEPVELNQLQITFDTDMTNPSMLNGAEPIAAKVVTDYTVELDDGTGWIIVAQITKNYLRQRRHTFAKCRAKRVRVTVLDTGNHSSARIFEIRCYGE